MITMTQAQKTQLANVISEFVKSKSKWQGTTTRLLKAVNKSLPEDIRTTSASIFRQRLNLTVNVIRRHGVKVAFTQTPGNNSKKLIQFSVV
jgi:hypothetical protein